MQALLKVKSAYHADYANYSKYGKDMYTCTGGGGMGLTFDVGHKKFGIVRTLILLSEMLNTMFSTNIISNIKQLHPRVNIARGVTIKYKRLIVYFLA